MAASCLALVKASPSSDKVGVGCTSVNVCVAGFSVFFKEFESNTAMWMCGCKSKKRKKRIQNQQMKF
jgi:hypothetical protein